MSESTEDSNSPFDKLNKDLKKYGLNVYRIFIGTMLIANLWLAQNYVKREEFEALKKSTENVERTILLMASQQETLKDHEMRIRAMEQRRP